MNVLDNIIYSPKILYKSIFMTEAFGLAKWGCYREMGMAELTLN